ncbi:MAG: bifunctional alpha/beta hydrolase/class I SAM-dependent methyltransferase [Myxococcota bacterium]
MTARPVEEHHFTTHDGEALFYRRWPARDRPQGGVLLFHRGHEHGGRLAHLVDELDLPDHTFYAWDARGHGRSPGERGAAPSLGALVRDIDAFVRHLGDTDGLAPSDLAIVAQSVGAVLATAWVHDYAPPLRALVVASPAFSVQLYVPLARPGLALLRRLSGPFFVNSYVKARMLTHDPARVASFEADPLVTRPISVDLLLALYEAGDRLVADARAITVPTQLLVSGDDWVVRQAPQHRFFVGLGSPTKERHVFEGFFHDTLGERDRAPAVARVRDFLRARFAAPPEVVSQRDAHRVGYTRDEAEALASPLPPYSPRGLLWAAVRAGIRLGAKLSDGLAVGVRTGFDSGSMLDYVYCNRAEGTGPLGRLIDRLHLDAVGWRGIRRRKVHLEELIGEALRRLQAQGLPKHVVDIAAGHGRYVVEALQAAPVPPDTVLLRDYDPLNVAAGARLLADARLDGVGRFVQADAFDEEGLAALAPAPTLAVVSGLYELFSDNALVARSLAGLGRAVPPGGWLVYTGQPWHPQLELIARALTSHRGGQAWVMRRRTQAELDQLVAAAGFDKVEQRIDEHGIFTVSLARRR